MPDYDNDRPKKTWKERDQQKDGSAHRKSDRSQQGGTGRAENSRAYRSYKTQLNKLFDGGGAVPDALKSKLEGVEVAADVKAAREALQALSEAMTPRKIKKALVAYQEEFGFPRDKAIVEKLLDLDDEAIVLQALSTLNELLEEGAIKRASSLKMRIKTAQMTVDTAEVKAAGDALLEKLR
ncbi:MAG: hypothetical protein VX699_13085 [Myxococcota bacterium]|nr:hypothetical protein [Myxococcota bacterium]